MFASRRSCMTVAAQLLGPIVPHTDGDVCYPRWSSAIVDRLRRLIVVVVVVVCAAPQQRRDEQHQTNYGHFRPEVTDQAYTEQPHYTLRATQRHNGSLKSCMKVHGASPHTSNNLYLHTCCGWKDTEV